MAGERRHVLPRHPLRARPGGNEGDRARHGRSYPGQPSLRSTPVTLSTVTEEYDALCRARLDHLVPVTQPLVLVSQVPRSGGHAAQPALRRPPGVPRPPARAPDRQPDEPPLAADRPRRDPTSGSSCCTSRTPGSMPGAATRSPPASGPTAAATWTSSRSSSCRGLQQRVFEQQLAERPRGEPPGRPRRVLHLVLQRLGRQPDAVRGAEAGRNRVRARPAREAGEPGGVLRGLSGRDARLDRARPARLVRVGAEPEAAVLDRRARARRSGATRRRRRCRRSAERPERVVVVTYEDLVRDTEGTMRLVAERVGISMRPELLVPTFNGRPIGRTRATGGHARRRAAQSWTASGRPVEELAGDLYGARRRSRYHRRAPAKGRRTWLERA